MAISTGQNGTDCLKGSDMPPVQLCRHGAGRSIYKALKKKNKVIKLYWVFHSIFFYLTANTRLDVVQNFMLRYVWK